MLNIIFLNDLDWKREEGCVRIRVCLSVYRTGQDVCVCPHDPSLEECPVSDLDLYRYYKHVAGSSLQQISCDACVIY